MKKYRYEITRHSADQFKEMVYFCTQEGECALEDVSSHQVNILQELLNQRGDQGWEVVQTVFGKGGLMVFWKRES